VASTDDLPGKPRTSTDKTRAPASRQGGVLARNAFHLFLGQIASTVLSIAFTAVLGRQLGAADFGVYFLLMSMSTFAYVVVDWGQSAYLIREVARRPGDAGVLLGSSLVLRSASAGLAAILTTLAARLLGYEMRTQLLAGLTVTCALPLALSQPYGYLFRGRDRMDLDATVSVTAKALTVAVAIPALLLGGQLPTIILVQGLAGAGALGVAILLARRIRMPSPSPSRKTVRELAVGGASIALFFLVISVQPYIDAIVLSKLAPATAMGWYAAARNIMGILLAPATILATASFPELSRVALDPTELRRAIRRALRPLLGLGVLGAVGTYLFADFAVTLIYGEGRFDPAVQVLQLFAPALLLFFVGILLGTVITAVGRTRELAVAKLICVTLTTWLAVLLVPYFQARFQNGGMGLVLAFGSTEIVMIMASVWLAPRGAFAPGTLLDVLRALGAGAATLAVFWWFPPVTPWLRLPASILVFAFFSLATGLFRWGEVSRQLASMLRSGRVSVLINRVLVSMFGRS
jgi:O-antigen/teichoic acid export membrane protein